MAKHNELTKEIKGFIDKAIAIGSGQSIPPVNSVSVADELQKFKILFDNGVITQEEFAAKKK